jgi:hypothetical protein
VRGFIGEVFMTIYSRIEEGGVIAGALLETEGERGLRGRGMTGGAMLSVRERGGSWVGLVRG